MRFTLPQLLSKKSFRGTLWVLIVAPLYLLFCNFAGSMAEMRDVHGALVLSWEQWIPFRPWTIIPYWSQVLVCGLSFFNLHGLFGDPKADSNQQMLDRHGERILFCLFFATICFVLFPQRFSYTPPHVKGMLGWLFALTQPYNQIPSLHTAIVVLIVARCRLMGIWRVIFNIWAFLVALSALTAWQYHFSGLLCGLVLGLLALWLIPDKGSAIWTLWQKRKKTSQECRILAQIYALAAVVAFAWFYFGLTNLSAAFMPIALLFGWTGFSLTIVALAYAWLGPEALRKHKGHFETSTFCLLLPYLIGVWLNARWLTRHQPDPVPVAERIWLGRMPSDAEMDVLSPEELRPDCGEPPFDAFLDCTAEMSAPSFAEGMLYRSTPMLDLEAPRVEDLAEAVLRLDSLHQARRVVLLVCARGSSRASLVAAVWLTWKSGANPHEVLDAFRRQGIPLEKDSQRLALTRSVALLKKRQNAINAF